MLWKNKYLHVYPSFATLKWRLRGYTFHGHVFIISSCVRMLSQDCRGTVLRHSYKCRKSDALQICQNFAATESRHLHESRTYSRMTVAQHTCHGFANIFFCGWGGGGGEGSHKMFKTFTTSSHIKILVTLERVLCKSFATEFAKQSRGILMPVRY